MYRSSFTGPAAAMVAVLFLAPACGGVAEDAMDAPFAGSSAGAGCTALGGTCMEVSQCGGSTVSGLCPGPASVRCCLPE